MALLTDCDFITGADLATLDGEVPAVAASQGITLDDPANGMIHRSLEDSTALLLRYQQQFGGLLASTNMSANHNAAVMNIGQMNLNRSRVLSTQIVVSTMNAVQWSPLKTWAAYRALAMFFREVSNRTGKDRYEEKADRYKKQSGNEYFQAVQVQGLPIVRQPLPAPGALYDPSVAGVFDASCVTTVAGAGTDTTDQFDIAVTWVAGTSLGGQYVSPTNKGNSESAPSARVTMPVNSTGNVFRVTIAGLTPPLGTQHPSQVPLCIVQYGTTTGWNVYAGQAGGTLYLQNATPIAIATKTYTFAGDPVQSGPVADTGQYADLWYSFQTMLQRG